MIADPISQPQFYRDVPMKRLFAWVIDTVIIIAIGIVVIPFTAFTAIFFFPFLLLVAGFLYRWATLSGKSATWGMRLMSIEFRDAEGRKLDSGNAFLHTLGYTISWAFLPVQIISIILMMTSARGQGVTDLVLNTTVLNKQL
ncbi:MAG: RDD family protein [Rhodobacteraceae bacterium]|nr:RDD family protein [Paracoccaceae bacterium]